MTKIKRTVVAIAAVQGLFGGLALLGPPTVNFADRSLQVTPVQEAHAAPNDANFKNVTTTNRAIYMCEDWGNTSCASDSRRRDLYPGQTTNGTFGWTDTDGFYVSAGYDVLMNNGGRWTRFAATGWTKYGGCADCTKQIKKVPNGENN